jgi:hypothetical protein
MTLLVTLDAVAVAAFAANFIHWAANGRARLLYWPTGSFGWVVSALVAAIAVLAPLTLVHVVPGHVFLLLLGLELLVASVFSITHRQGVRRAARITAVA